MPITGTEIELRNFSSQMAASDRGMRFHVVAYSAKTKLPGDPEEKPAFDEITVLGDLALRPGPRGWLRASVVGLDLSNLKGLAAEEGVTLDQGILDLGLGMRFQDDGGVSLNSRISFRDLSLTEKENGFLYRLLKLPASTDTVIFLLRDHTGTISFSFGLDVPAEGGVSTGRITSLAITKVSELIALAVLKSPLRVGAGIVGIVGIGAGEEEPEDPVVVAFRPGTTELTKESRRDFVAVVERMQDEDDLVLTLTHELGKGDLAPVETRYNPDAQDSRAIATYLRLRQRRLMADRAEVVERARAFVAAGREEDAERTRRQLRAIDRSIGNVARELDQVLAILQRGSERRRDRRTRLGCVALGRMRIEELARQLRAAEIDPDRIRYRRPRFTDPTIEAGGVISIQPGRRIDTAEPEAGEKAPAPDDSAPDDS